MMENVHGVIGCSPAMQRVRKRLEMFADVSLPVLITGETGTGKNLFARTLARMAGMEKRLLSVNCASLSESLILSELFGHRRGAFTGAVQRHVGLFARANGGMLFLDEIGELPIRAQAKLLRTIETGRFRPLGAEREKKSEFRLIVATNSNLEELVAAKKFRRDLHHRLGAARIRVPTLRDRIEDIPLLATFFLREFRARNEGRLPKTIASKALDRLRSFEWPGNVRQLKNVVETASVIAAGRTAIQGKDVEAVLRTLGALEKSSNGRPPLRLRAAVEWVEERVIRRALRHSSGHRGRAADLLGVSEATLYRKLKRFGA